MEKKLLFLLFMVSLFMCTQAEATVLTYNGWAGDNDDIASFIDGADENYGSRISSSPVAYTGAADISAVFEAGNGWTPNIELTWGGDRWDTYTGWRGHEVAQVQGSSPEDPLDLVFTPDAGYGVLINSFDLDEWAGGGGCVVDWEVFDATGTLASGTWTGNTAGYRSTVNTGLTIGDMTVGNVVTLRFMQTAGDGTYVAMDDTNFDQFGGERAANPSPANEAIDVPREVVLSWTPGIFAAPINGHKVYLSENFNDVNDGIGGIAQDANSYAPAQRLDFGTTYYWRIDEVNAPPDSTIFKGEVWSFTVEPFAYPIAGENITATASSQTENQGPENTINGSGLDVNDLDLHSTELTEMWLSAPAGQQPTWIQYEFDKVYKLHEMWVWNHNGLMEPMMGIGFKDVSIEYSVNGTDYTTLGTTHEFAQGTAAAGYEHNTTVDFGGIPVKFVRLTANSSWVGFLPQYGLSEVRFLYIPVHAREPGPDSGATDVDVDVTLGFKAGREAAKHDVYLSTDEQAVIDGTAPVTTVTETSYSTSLDIASTYYWRVDEVNDVETPTTWQGDIWSFTTPEYLVVDDFELYNDLDPGDPNSNRIFNTWIDGLNDPANGSLVGYDVPPFAEQIIVHGGEQAMPFLYSNTGGATYSEAERTFAVPQDWTKAGIQTLVLYLRADSLSEALDTTLSFTTDGSADWFSQAASSYHDGDAAQSGVISANQESLMQTTVSGAGVVSFYWKVSSESGYDFLEFYIDGSLQDQISGEGDWQQMTYTITASGSHTLEWRYTKDGNTSDGNDCGWADKLEWDGGGQPANMPGNTGQLYVKVDDVKVDYPGNVADIQWMKWNIDLASLGVDLQAVTTLAIGIEGGDASGTLYFDDFRLEPAE